MNVRLLIISVLFSFLSGLAHAGLSISVNPTDGGTSLRFRPGFGHSSELKELRVRISSTDGKRYRVFQRFVEPMRNEKGETLDFRALEVVSVPGSNSAGTLYIQAPERISMGEQLLYSSGQNGPGDIFALNYSFDPQVPGSGGVYSGQLLLAVRSLEDGSQAQVTIPVSLEKASERKFEVSGTRNKNRVEVRDIDSQNVLRDQIEVDFAVDSDNEVRIYQEAVILPAEVMGREMPADALRFSVDSASGQGIRQREFETMSRSRVLVYSGRSSQDKVFVRFLLDSSNLPSLDAGEYKGRLRYTIETAGNTESADIDLDCEIQPVFSMEVAPPAQGMQFGNLIPGQPSREQVVTVKVKTNLRRPYQVMQTVPNLMTNEKGKPLPKDAFQMKVEIPAGERGRSKITGFTAVEEGEYPVFSSNAQGDSAVFNVIYQMQPEQYAEGGQYAAPIRFSLNQN